MEDKDTDDVCHSAIEIDERRHKQVAYEYLCHLEEAKTWLEAVLKEPLPLCTELEENLRNGVILAKLGNLVVPNVVPRTRIFDADQKRYKAAGLQFRHTDNINYWLKSLHTVQLPVAISSIVELPQLARVLTDLNSKMCQLKCCLSPLFYNSVSDFLSCLGPLVDNRCYVLWEKL